MITTRTIFFLAVAMSFGSLSSGAEGSRSPTDAVAALTGFSWERVPLCIHFGKRSGDMTDAEIEFLATHGQPRTNGPYYSLKKLMRPTCHSARQWLSHRRPLFRTIRPSILNHSSRGSGHEDRANRPGC